MRLVQTLAPTTEPLTLAEAKIHLRVDEDLVEDDALIERIIKAARRYAEKETQRSLITQKWSLVGDCFPGGSWQVSPGISSPHSLPPHAVLLQRGPVQSVDSIVYIDMSGVVRTITAPAAPDYAIDLSGPIARMTPGFGRIWPITLPQIGAATVNYTAGYGNAASDVPDDVVLWMLAAVETMYRNRGVLLQLSRGERTDAFAFCDGLLDSARVVMA